MSSRVFLSSTYVDLKSHREAAQKAIRQLGAVDVSMEHFGARDERPVKECIHLVQNESDLFVGVYAHRYGYIPDGKNLSISELEYKAAADAGLPKFIYAVDEKYPWIPSHIDKGKKGAKLKSFKEFLFKNHICQTFGSAEQLAMSVAADLGRHIAMERAAPVGRLIPVKDIGLDSIRGPVGENTPDDWNERRNRTYDSNRNVFLAHIIRPSSKPEQEFDVFIYLIRHKSAGFSDVSAAEFFLGPHWGNKVFPAVEQNGFIGISTAAYGTFLCVCRVTFKDGTHVYLDRYIDFEMELHRSASKG